jgi:hypothetical protein
VLAAIREAVTSTGDASSTLASRLQAVITQQQAVRPAQVGAFAKTFPDEFAALKAALPANDAQAAALLSKLSATS